MATFAMFCRFCSSIPRRTSMTCRTPPAIPKRSTTCPRGRSNGSFVSAIILSLSGTSGAADRIAHQRLYPVNQTSLAMRFFNAAIVSVALVASGCTSVQMSSERNVGIAVDHKIGSTAVYWDSSQKVQISIAKLALNYKPDIEAEERLEAEARAQALVALFRNGAGLHLSEALSRDGMALVDLKASPKTIIYVTPVQVSTFIAKPPQTDLLVSVAAVDVATRSVLWRASFSVGLSMLDAMVVKSANDDTLKSFAESVRSSLKRERFY